MCGQMIFVSDTLTTTYHLNFLPENHSHFELGSTYENWEPKQIQVQRYMPRIVCHQILLAINMVEHYPQVKFMKDIMRFTSKIGKHLSKFYFFRRLFSHDCSYNCESKDMIFIQTRQENMPKNVQEKRLNKGFKKQPQIGKNQT